MPALDMTEILLRIDQLAEGIKECDEMKEYLEWKRRVTEDVEAQRLIQEFQRFKEKVEEVERFGHFHPDYRSAKKEAAGKLSQLAQHPLIGSYMKAEEKLDQLLSEVSRLIAQPVSETIKVPINDPRQAKKRSGCG
ncbi:YlbF family regulator [Mechercharimyces sp. CAU 1602]|uniref:YlbF family regulator n=1 Tax=Mechercharimyces sp. CAU 1602 TaxID=2973933 RepID=UPI002163C902|nr:YlbF family regulator [Mechercharimyces sp. CAU 1602]MCS1350180.1 YlbF family regulator [Mechercharimyces sp. CAU 1602]